MFTLQEDQLRKIELNLSEDHDINKKKGGGKQKGDGKGKGKEDGVATKGKGMEDLPSSDSEPDSEELDKMEQLNLIKTALQQTRRILENID